MTYRFDYITLLNGTEMSLDSPSSEVMDIKTMAHSLSNLCRFIGHTKKFYSVAQHSVLVSHLVPPAFAFEGLMHDAAEAFCGDISSPIKARLPEFRRLEKRINCQLAKRYNLPLTLSAEVLHADRVALVTEAKQLTKSKTYMHWFEDIKPVDISIIPLTPAEANVHFTRRFDQLVMEISDQNPDFTEELELCEQLDKEEEEYWQEQAYDWQ